MPIHDDSGHDEEANVSQEDQYHRSNEGPQDSSSNCILKRSNDTYSSFVLSVIHLRLLIAIVVRMILSVDTSSNKTQRDS